MQPQSWYQRRPEIVGVGLSQISRIWHPEQTLVIYKVWRLDFQLKHNTDDVFGITKTKDSVFLQISTAMALKNNIQDKDLSWCMFSLLKTNFIKHIIKAIWPLHIWWNIGTYHQVELWQ